MTGKFRTLLALMVILTFVTTSYAGSGTLSKYLELASDALITSDAGTTVISTTVNLPSTQWVFVQSDGRYFPNVAGLAYMSIYIDGVKESNDSTIDWTSSTNPLQHSFNCIAAKSLSAGNHTFALVAGKSGGSYYVGSKSNLSVLVNPAATSRVSNKLASDSSRIQYTNGASLQCTTSSSLPSSLLLSNTVGAQLNKPIVALASGRSYVDDVEGDATWGIYYNGVYKGNKYAQWTNNDLFTGAERQAPMFAQALFIPASGETGSKPIQLRGTVFPWTSNGVDNHVSYYVGARTTLITFTDFPAGAAVGTGTPIDRNTSFQSGGCTADQPPASPPWKGYYPEINFANYFPVGSSTGSYSACLGSCAPPSCDSNGPPWTSHPCWNQEVTLSSGTITVPSGSTRAVMIMAKALVQGDDCDRDVVKLYLKLSGSAVGSHGVQELNCPNGASNRTISASYLAFLAPGSYGVEVVGKVEQNASWYAQWVSLQKSLALLWFE